MINFSEVFLEIIIPLSALAENLVTIVKFTPDHSPYAIFLAFILFDYATCFVNLCYSCCRCKHGNPVNMSFEIAQGLLFMYFCDWEKWAVVYFALMAVLQVFGIWYEEHLENLQEENEGKSSKRSGNPNSDSKLDIQITDENETPRQASKPSTLNNTDGNQGSSKISFSNLLKFFKGKKQEKKSSILKLTTARKERIFDGAQALTTMCMIILADLYGFFFSLGTEDSPFAGKAYQTILTIFIWSTLIKVDMSFGKLRAAIMKKKLKLFFKRKTWPEISMDLYGLFFAVYTFAVCVKYYDEDLENIDKGLCIYSFISFAFFGMIFFMLNCISCVRCIFWPKKSEDPAKNGA